MMRPTNWILCALMVSLSLSLCGDAHARKANWNVQVSGVLLGGIFDSSDNKIARVNGKVKNIPSILDTTATVHLQIRFGGDFYRIPGLFPDDSDRRSKLRDDPDADESLLLDALLDALVDIYGTTKEKKPKVGLVPIDVSSVTPSGKISVNKKFSKVKLKANYAFEGVVTGGEFAGNTFRGKYKLKAKGPRAD